MISEALFFVVGFVISQTVPFAGTKKELVLYKL